MRKVVLRDSITLFWSQTTLISPFCFYEFLFMWFFELEVCKTNGIVVGVAKFVHDIGRCSIYGNV